MPCRGVVGGEVNRTGITLRGGRRIRHGHLLPARPRSSTRHAHEHRGKVRQLEEEHYAPETLRAVQESLSLPDPAAVDPFDMQLNWTELLKSTMVMFAVIDIVGSIPFLLDIKKKAGDIHAEKASLVALGIMLAFLFLGKR